MDFELPYALDVETRLIAVEQGQKGISYFCPGCREKVLYRQGEIRASHFAHYPNLSCSREAVLQRIGQRLFVGRLEASLKGEASERPLPQLNRMCPGECRSIKRVEIPKGAVRAVVDYKMPSGEVVDIMLLDPQDNPLLAIEIAGIRHDHHDARAKIQGIPWIAVRGNDILAEGTSWFVESNETHEGCLDCSRIEEERRRFKEECRKASLERQERFKVLEPQEKKSENRYRELEFERALIIIGDRSVSHPDKVFEWKIEGFTLTLKSSICQCKKNTPVYAWPDGKFFGQIPADKKWIPPGLTPVEGTPLYASVCWSCKHPFIS